jgi:hypothetical protein
MSFGTKPRERAKEPLELVHTDVLGPVEVESPGGARHSDLHLIGYTTYMSKYIGVN